MDVAGLLADLFGRVDDEIDGAIDGLSADELRSRLHARLAAAGAGS